MSDDFAFRSDLKGEVKDAFDVSNPPTHYGPDNRELAFRVFKVQSKAAELQETARSHFSKHRDTWIEKEFAKLKRENPLQPGLSLSRGPKAPGSISNTRQAHRDSLLKLAAAKVDLRQEVRLHTIKAIEDFQVRKLEQVHRRENSHNQTRKLKQ